MFVIERVFNVEKIKKNRRRRFRENSTNPKKSDIRKMKKTLNPKYGPNQSRGFRAIDGGLKQPTGRQTDIPTPCLKRCDAGTYA